MDISSLLKNETVLNLLKKFNIPEEQAKSIANQAIAAIQTKFNSNPKQMSSLLSENPNTEDDENLKAEVENDFLEKLTQKVGLPENVASQIKGSMPDILSQITGKLSSENSNNESGIAGMFGQLMDMFEDKSATSKSSGKKKGGFLSMLTGLFSKK